MQKLCRKKRFLWIVLATQKNYILEFNQYMKSDKMRYKIYANIEFLIQKIDQCKSNPEKFSTTKIRKHVSEKYSISIFWVFNCLENRQSFHCGEDGKSMGNVL